MKNIIYLTFSLIILSTFKIHAQSANCIFTTTEFSKTKYVHPVYSVGLSYFFEKSSKEAYALVTWNFEPNETRHCFEEGKKQFPETKLLIPPVSVSKVQLKVMGSNEYYSLDTFPLANGHWSASTQMISIPYSSKEMIKNAIENKLSIAEFSGDPRMRISIVEKKPVATIKCTDKTQEAGVLNLFNRLKYVKERADSMTFSAGVNTEEALEDFFNTCVRFDTVNADSFVEFDQNQKIYSKIIKGEFSLLGRKARDSYHEMRGFLHQNVTIQDI